MPSVTYVVHPFKGNVLTGPVCWFFSTAKHWSIRLERCCINTGHLTYSWRNWQPDWTYGGLGSRTPCDIQALKYCTKSTAWGVFGIKRWSAAHFSHTITGCGSSVNPIKCIHTNVKAHPPTVCVSVVCLMLMSLYFYCTGMRLGL